jgi:hypothetical protein
LAHLLSEKAGQKYKISREEQKLFHEYTKQEKGLDFGRLSLF